ncbi:MAG: AraC family transcriptional regulator [bacterium]|nr:AraC family transcriptional regulator [bacterium]
MMKLAQINPVVRSAGKTTFLPGYDGQVKSGSIEDHDLHLAYRGRGVLIIDGCRYSMEVGDVVTVFPGESFCVEVEGDKPFSRYYVHLDFFKDKSERLLTPVLEGGITWPRHVRLMHDTRARELCADVVLRALSRGTDEASSIIIEGNIRSLLGIMVEQYSGRQKDEVGVYTKCRRNILQAERFIRENYRRNLTLTEIAGAAGFSPDYFGRAFKALMGCSPLNYLAGYRLNEAKRLMVENDFAIGEIARQVGYEDIHYFSYLFKHREGITPSEFISRLAIEE